MRGSSDPDRGESHPFPPWAAVSVPAQCRATGTPRLDSEAGLLRLGADI